MKAPVPTQTDGEIGYMSGIGVEMWGSSRTELL